MKATCQRGTDCLQYQLQGGLTSEPAASPILGLACGFPQMWKRYQGHGRINARETDDLGREVNQKSQSVDFKLSTLTSENSLSFALSTFPAVAPRMRLGLLFYPFHAPASVSGSASLPIAATNAGNYNNIILFTPLSPQRSLFGILHLSGH